MSRITVVGCGMMGSSLVRAFMQGGHELYVVDINEKALEPLEKEGAHAYSKLRDVPDTDFIVVNLPTSKISKEVVEPVDLDGKIVINTTTSTPLEAVEMQKLVESKDGLYLDSKILCYPAEIGTEIGFIVYSGSKKVFDMVKEDLKSLSPEPMFLGEKVEAAAVADATAVGPHYGMFFSVLESTALCIKHGFSVDEFLKMVEMLQPTLMEVVTRQVSSTFSNFDGTYKDAQDATLDIELEGLKMFIRVLEQSNINAEYSKCMCKMMQSASDEGYGKKDIVAVMSQILDR